MVQLSIIDKNIAEYLTTENLYKIFNQYVMPFLNDEEQAFVKELEDFVLEELVPKINLDKDVYELFPILGKRGYIQRKNPDYRENIKPTGMKYEVLLAMVLSIADPELDLARLASGILCGNPLYEHPISDSIVKAKEEIFSGQKIGCICITEPNQGSDAVNMKSLVKKTEGGVLYNGEKIFTTNGPKADYFISYAVEDINNPRQTMYQALLNRQMKGLSTNRLKIVSVPRVHIGQTLWNDVFIPDEYITGPAGKGYKILFEGLVPERISIFGSSLGIGWQALITAMIYTNKRVQFGRNVFSFQGVGFNLANLLVELEAATQLSLKIAGTYEDEVKAGHPDDLKKFNASLSAMAKYYAAKLSHDIAYECQNMMGGVALTDNTSVDRALEISKLEEVIGGARNIQLLLVQRSIKNAVKTLG
ncbi:MAG: acyl-CoA dehydrogenase family protein [Promethearchaeota archaeon]